MTENLSIPQQQKILFFRKNFDELYKFITNGNIGESDSMKHLLRAYDFDEAGRKKKKEQGDTDEEIEKKYDSYKNNCRWFYNRSNILITETDVYTAIEAFFWLTGLENSRLKNKEYVEHLTRNRNLLFDTYFYLLDENRDVEIKQLSYYANFEVIIRDEAIIGAIMKHFGLAGHDIGSHLENYKQLGIPNDFYVKAFELFRILRNAYGHSFRSDSILEQELDHTFLSDFNVCDSRSALKFEIFFYIGLICILNKIWHIDKFKDRLANTYTCPCVLFEPQPLKCGLRVIPTNNNSKFKISIDCNHNTVEIDEVEDIYLDNLEFSDILPCTQHTIRVYYPNEEHDYKYVVKFNGTCWEDTIVLLPQKGDSSFKHSVTDDLRPINSYVDDKIEPLVGNCVEKDAADQKEGEFIAGVSDVDDLLEEKDVECVGGWTLHCFRVGCSESPSDLGWTLDGIMKKGHTGRIFVPNFFSGVKSISYSFFRDLHKMGGGVVIVSKDVDFYNVPDNVEVIKKRSYESNEKFSYKKNGLIYQCQYIEQEYEERDIYGACSILGMTSEDGEKMPEEIIVPTYADGLLVTEIGSWAFKNLQVTEIELPNGIKKIGEGAFASSTIWKMHLPDGVNEISSFMFQNCESLQIVECRRIVKIGEYAFKGCIKLEAADLAGNYRSGYEIPLELDLPSLEAADLAGIPRLEYNISLQLDLPPGGKIPTGAFMNCQSLEAAHIDVEKIGELAFFGCKSLRWVESPYAVNHEYFRIVEIGKFAFGACDRLDSIFGFSRGNFIMKWNGSPRRKKLHHVFDDDVRIFDDGYKEFTDSVGTLWNRIYKKHPFLFKIFIFLFDGILIFLIGKYFNWW